nr:O-methyltransferase [Lentibacillus sediminis]
MDEQLNTYLYETLLPKEDWVLEMEQQAKKDHVPIMDPVSMEFIMQLIRLHQPVNILEIGTAIGYSALRMLQANPDAAIITIEKDDTRYHQAVRNIERQQHSGQINVIHGDALDEISKLVETGTVFDLVLIDAAKGQYKRFFELAAPLLRGGGLVLSDNVLFRGHVADPASANPRHAKMVEKLRDYNKWMMEHTAFSSSIVPVGDGIAISIKTAERSTIR